MISFEAFEIIKIMKYDFRKFSIWKWNFDLFQAKYINEAIDEIKQELKQDNIAIKANAVNKLTYVWK
jgi:hypothetical protein